MSTTPTCHSLHVSRTARVATLGDPAKAKEWWIVLHGYGQLAGDFVREFDGIAEKGRFIVAPEGLSRFYVDALEEHDEVGASWMTHEDRSNEIADYVAYLDDVVQHLGEPDHNPFIGVLGFSQGAATASRWALLGDTTVDRLVLWGGGPAHDLDLSVHAEALRGMNLRLVLGRDDPYLTAERRAAADRRLSRHEIPVTVHTFDGGHHLDDETLETVVRGEDGRDHSDPR